MKKLEVNDTFKEVKYLGPSSNFMLVKHAMDVSNQYNGAINHVFRKRPRYWEPNAVSIHASLTFAALTYILQVGAGRWTLGFPRLPTS